LTYSDEEDDADDVDDETHPLVHRMISMVNGWGDRDANAKLESTRVEERKADAEAYLLAHPASQRPSRYSIEDFRYEGDHIVWAFTHFVPPSPGFPLFQPNYTICFERVTPLDSKDTTIYGANVYQSIPTFAFSAEEKWHGGLGRLLNCSNGAVDIYAKAKEDSYSTIYGVRDTPGHKARLEKEAERKAVKKPSSSSWSSSDD
jgi:hypothetical protein